MSEPLTLLYVEDNGANFTLCQRVLESTGLYKVRRADSSEQALELLKEFRPALILLDLDLPGMGGIELAQHLQTHADFAAIPIIVVTASVMQLERRRALEAGAAAFLEKPFDIGEMRTTVAEVLNWVSGAPSQPS